MKEDKKEKLISTATKLFEEKGFDGVKMRELSEKAGVNKGLVHYYFKNKDAIFMEVFKRKAGKMYINLEEILSEPDSTFEEKVAKMVDEYMKMLAHNPKLPLFVFSEVNKNPHLLEQMKFGETIGTTVKLLSKILKQEGSKLDGFQFLLSTISLCIFPNIMQPMLSGIMLKQNPKMDMKIFLNKRKPIIVKTLVNSIQS